MSMFGETGLSDVRSMCVAIKMSNIELLASYTKRGGQSSTDANFAKAPKLSLK
jgi:hypothetical protein